MDTKWTPGPWRASATREVFSPSKRTVCRAHLDGERCTEALANAHLIAAAPDMYEALERLAGMKPGRANAATAQDLYLTVRAIAESALAKARGESA